MSTRIINTPFHSGDLLSERAARRVTAHRRPVVAPEAVAPSGGRPGTGPKILRRWSVAELIARAAAGPPVQSTWPKLTQVVR